MTCLQTRFSILAASLAALVFMPALRPAMAAEPRNDPPPANREPQPPPPEGRAPGNPPPGDRRPRGGPREMQRAIEQLDLAADKKQAALAMVETLRQKEEQARDEFLKQLKESLTPQQFEKFEASLDQMPPPPRDDDRQERRGGEGQPGRPPGEGRSSRGAAPQPKAFAGPAQPAVAIPANGTVEVPVTFTGGYETDRRDGGRPVVLIAAALGVPTDVFRKAFSGVTPARGAEPEPAQVRKNKQALMEVLRPYGITNDQLDTVSNQYRYNASKGQMWRNTPATATATVRNGIVTGFTVTDAGCGYSSMPTVSVPGVADVKAEATLNYGKDFKTNGSISAIKIIALSH